MFIYAAECTLKTVSTAYKALIKYTELIWDWVNNNILQVCVFSHAKECNKHL